MQARRHHPLQVSEHLGPGERLALKQVVKKLGAVAGTAIGGQAEDGFSFGFLLIAGRNLLPALFDQAAVLARRDPA
jgi:hypothetical protein